MSRQLPICKKCGGTGNIPSFAHVMGGTCFRCAGSGHAHNPPEPTPTPRGPETPWPYRELVLVQRPWRVYRTPYHGRLLAVPKPLWPKQGNPDGGWFFEVENGRVVGDMESAPGQDTVEKILAMHPELISPKRIRSDAWLNNEPCETWDAWHRFLKLLRASLQGQIKRKNR